MISEFEGKKGTLSASPFFRHLQKFVEQNENFKNAFSGTSDVSDNVFLVALAKRKMGDLNGLPPYLERALDIVNAFAKANLEGDIGRAGYILKELNNDKMPLTEEALDKHMKRILSPQQNIRGKGKEY